MNAHDLWEDHIDFQVESLPNEDATALEPVEFHDSSASVGYAGVGNTLSFSDACIKCGYFNYEDPFDHGFGLDQQHC